MSKPELKAGLASISSNVMSGRLTPRLQSVRPSYSEGGDLLDQEASNAFQPPHYWKPCLIEQYGCFKPNPTADLNFYRYLSLRKCHSIIANGIRAVFINIHYAVALFNGFYSKKECDFWLSSKSENTNAKGNFLPSLSEGVSVTL